MYFPQEILSAILCYQPKIELKKARLVCKVFDAAAVPFLFNVIFVVARYADIKKATLLASRFGPFVKTLIFRSEYFEPGGLSWDVFKHEMADIDLARRNFPSYCKLREEQEELLNEGELFGHLCSTLIVLSNIQKVVLTNDFRTQGLCWCHQAYVDGCLRTFNPWSDEDDPALKSLRTAPDHECVKSTHGLKHMDSNAWPEILRALSTSGNTKVKAIAIDGGEDRSGLVISAFCMTPRQRFCAAKVLPNLTSLHLHLDVDFTHDFEDELYSEQVIAQTLSAAINLESLMIKVVRKDLQWEE